MCAKAREPLGNLVETVTSRFMFMDGVTTPPSTTPPNQIRHFKDLVVFSWIFARNNRLGSNSTLIESW